MATLANGDLRVFLPQLGTVSVTAVRDEAETGFKASGSDTATRSGADLLDVPQAITVITAKVIETQQALSVQDVLQNVAGVITRPTVQGAAYSIRGFTQGSTLSNGVSNPYASSSNIASVERVEILKGPQAILSGGSSLGGGINIVTKKPTTETVRDLAIQYGSKVDASVSLDLAGAMSEDRTLSYRVIGSIARAERSDAGFDGREKDYLLAQVRWKDDATDFIAGVSYDDQRQALGRNTYALGGSIQPIPAIRLGAKQDGIQVRSKALSYSVEHAFSPAVTLVSRAQYTQTEQDLNVWGARFPISTADMRLMFGNSNSVSEFDTLSGDHYLRLSFETGPLHHTLSTGLNHSRTQNVLYGYSGPTVPVSVYGDSQPAFPTLTRNADTLYAISDLPSEQYALFAQDLIRFGDWNLLLGLRRSEFKSGPTSTTYPQFGIVQTTAEETLTKTTPNAGLVYHLTSNVSLYASYAEGFLPQASARRCDGGIGFPPMETENKELGVKVNSRDGAFAWTAAGFQLDQSNRPEYINSQDCSTLRDGQRVRGFETEASGRLLPGWNLIANYTYTASKDMGDERLVPTAQPRHQGSVWTTWDFHHGAMEGLGLALGISAYSEARIGTLATSPMAPGGARVDVGASYAQDDWSLRLGVKNLFDRDLYGYSSSEIYVPVQEGRTMSMTFRKSF
nr:TonB-dependent receptor [Luteimonas sp. XNQY3]